MKAFRKLALVAVAASVLLATGAASAQNLKQQIVGSWKLVSVTNEKDGKLSEVFGAKPIGLFTFTADGYFSTLLFRAERPNFASDNRDTGTPEENRLAVQGSLASFGTYSVDDGNSSITQHYVASTFPNWNGTTQKRTIHINGDDMKFSNPAASVGGKAELILHRAK